MYTTEYILVKLVWEAKKFFATEFQNLLRENPL